MLSATMSAATLSATVTAAASLNFTDFAGGFSVSGLAHADLASSFSVSELRNSDFAGSFKLSELSYADFTGTFKVSAYLYSDFAASFAVENGTLAHSDFIGTFSVMTGVIMSFSPSAARTVTINAGLKPYTTGDLWDMSNPKSPRSPKDSDSTVDYSFNWAPWLADVVDSISSHQILVTDGLVNAGSSVVGNVVTVFVSAGTPSMRAALTCRIATNSVPARVEDRTIYLDIQAA